ncbi:MAG: hypothetical protein WBE53_21600 [Pseudolabrys sp.]|jgi:cytochrome b subunit of formate dehydrogenase
MEEALMAKKIRATMEAKAEGGVTVDAKVQRGQESWTFIYITLGFAISIEGTVISMMPPCGWRMMRPTLASDMPFASECLVSATAAIASEAFIRRSHLLPELRQVHSDF